MNWRRAIRPMFWLAFVCAALVGVVFVFFETWTVPGDDPQFAVSIEPTLSVGDLLLVSRSAGGTGDGALVRCTDPDAPARFVAGRVVGQPGDAVEFNGGSMLVNNQTPTASIACDPAVVHVKNPATQEDEDLSCFLEELGGGTHAALHSSKNLAGRDSKAEVEPGKVFIASDNRPMHLDSRDFNTLVPGNCHRIALRLWSANGWLDAKKRLTVLW
ncbi:MAG TPA: signal peptidase I [Polyangiaceae bacterium]|nr:signal peptidase I [Polyangiaceae bacterium]